jgi:hypothetical protein
MEKRAKDHAIAAMLVVMSVALLGSCTDGSLNSTQPLDTSIAPRFAKGANGPTVSSLQPAASKRDTTLDVQVIGSGFSAGSRVDFLLGGSVDSKIRTNSTRYVSSTALVANITIAADAAIDYRDVAVTTLAGKKGIGTESFVVLNGGELTVTGLTEISIRDINSSGIAVGFGKQTTSGCTNRGFVWSQSTGAMLLPMPTGYCASIGDAISEGSVIIGPIARKSSPYELARWTPNGSGSWNVEVIGRPVTGATWLTTHGVNDTGSISSSWRNADATLDSWYWNQQTGWLRLARPAGSTFCELEKMNDRDEMVGYCHTPSTPGTYWAGPYAPATLLPSPQGGLAGDAFVINASGAIRGVGTIGGVNHTLRWIPDGSGGWTVEDLGTLAVADRNEQGSVLVTTGPRAQYIPAGGVAESLGVRLSGGLVANQSVDGTTWVIGIDATTVAVKQRSYWFKR